MQCVQKRPNLVGRQAQPRHAGIDFDMHARRPFECLGGISERARRVVIEDRAGYAQPDRLARLPGRSVAKNQDRRCDAIRSQCALPATRRGRKHQP